MGLRGAAGEPLKDHVANVLLLPQLLLVPGAPAPPPLSLSFGHSVTSVEPNGFGRGVRKMVDQRRGEESHQSFITGEERTRIMKQEVRSLWLPPGNASAECQRSVMT